MFACVPRLLCVLCCILELVSGRVIEANTGHNFHAVNQTEFDCSAKVDGFYPNPNSCSSYYICESSTAFYQACIPGLLFNTGTFFCEDEKTVVHCNVTSAPTTSTSTTPETTLMLTTTTASTSAVTTTPTPTTTEKTTTRQSTTERTTVHTETTFERTTYHHRTTAVPTTTPDCNGQTGVYLRDPNDCSKYYECSNNSPIHLSCAPPLVFSIDILTCDFVSNVAICQH